MARSAEDILKEAILLETRGKLFYANVAEKCDSPSAKKVFEMMSKEEDEHIKFLRDQFKNYTEKHSFFKPEAPEENPEETIILNVLTDKIKKVKELYLKSGAAEESLQEIINYTQKANSILEKLSISDKNKIVLRSFSDQLMKRKV